MHSVVEEHSLLESKETEGEDEDSIHNFIANKDK